MDSFYCFVKLTGFVGVDLMDFYRLAVEFADFRLAELVFTLEVVAI